MLFYKNIQASSYPDWCLSTYNVIKAPQWYVVEVSEPLVSGQATTMMPIVSSKPGQGRLNK